VTNSEGHQKQVKDKTTYGNEGDTHHPDSGAVSACETSVGFCLTISHIISDNSYLQAGKYQCNELLSHSLSSLYQWVKNTAVVLFLCSYAVHTRTRHKTFPQF
jgi:hypothetical protein